MDTQFSVPRVHCPEERLKEGEKLSIHFCADGETWKLFFDQFFLFISSVSTEQSQICVMKNKACHVRTGRLVLAGQSDPSFVPTSLLMKTPTPSTEDLAQDLLQKYKEQVERLSQQNRVSKFCTDAGFLTTGRVGQYFMSEDTEEFSQITESVACREYKLPRDEIN